MSLTALKNRIRSLFFLRPKWPVEVIEYPTDVHFVGDGQTESITLTGNLFWCAWGMKGIRQANPDFIEEWLTTENVDESAVVLRRSSTLKADVFIPRGTNAPAQLIPDKPIPSSAGALRNLKTQHESSNGKTK